MGNLKGKLHRTGKLLPFPARSKVQFVWRTVTVQLPSFQAISDVFVLVQFVVIGKMDCRPATEQGLNPPLATLAIGSIVALHSYLAVVATSQLSGVTIAPLRLLFSRRRSVTEL